MQKFLETDLIFLTIAGSSMYGTTTEDSDIDKRGVCVPPKNVVMGFARNFEQYEDPKEDTVIFSLMKFIELASVGNPNILELIFAPKKCIQVQHPTWLRFIEHRQKLLTVEAFPKFMGYATSQLKRMLTHRDLILNAPDHPPTRVEFGLENIEGAKELIRGVDATQLDPSVMEVINKEKKYRSAAMRWDSYQNWVKTRNPKRFGAEAKCGYDGKNAAHLIRVLRMLVELLLTGDLSVERSDAKELLEIRNGMWSYETLMQEVEILKTKAKEILDNKKYVIAENVDRLWLSDLAVELHEFHWNLTK